MSLELYIGFVIAATALVATPGPNVALIIANSIAGGFRAGLATVGGTASAIAIQLVLTVLGASAILAVMADWFQLLRWIGVAYLVFLGVRAFRAQATELAVVRPEALSPKRIWLRGFLVSISNPKTLLFFGAFLPQFVKPGPDATRQLAILAATFFVLSGVGDSLWAVFARPLARALRIDGRLRNRLTGGLLIGAGVGLALARRP
ncbi:MAG: LysE family translocator [Hyphomicrobiales bacterium]|nr:LysE family translocator [Hyphomicrobiales bacterium]